RATLVPHPSSSPLAARAAWERWQAGLTLPITLPADLPPLRVLLVLDNLAGHRTPELVLWLFAHGVMPVYTPLSGSWLNMAESIQRILKRRALAGQDPGAPQGSKGWVAAGAGRRKNDPPPVWRGGGAAGTPHAP